MGTKDEEILVQLDRLEEILKALKEAGEQESLLGRFSSYTRACAGLAELDPDVLPGVQRGVLRRRLDGVRRSIERELRERASGDGEERAAADETLRALLRTVEDLRDEVNAMKKQLFHGETIVLDGGVDIPRTEREHDRREGAVPLTGTWTEPEGVGAE